MPPRGAQQRGTGPPRGGRGRGGGASRGGGVAVAPSAGRGGGIPPPVPAHVKTIGVRRPGYGTGGRTVNTIVNAFPVTTQTGLIFHYDIAIEGDKFPARMNMLLFERLRRVAAPTVFTRPVVYDGKKNAFSTYRLDLGPRDSGTFNVSLNEGTGDRPPKVYKVKVTKAAEINSETLQNYIIGQQSHDNTVLTAITALNVVVRMDPYQRFPFNTRSFFTPDGKRNIGKGIELWRGYFQSIRPTYERMYINVDIATGTMYRAGPLITLCLEFLEKTDPTVLDPTKGLPDRIRLSLQRFIANVRIKTTYGGKESIRVIKKLSTVGAASYMFKMRDDTSISVADYFRRHANRQLKYPNILCVELGSGAAIPLELCEVVSGQIMRKQLPQDKTSDMVEFSKMAPQQRLHSIRAGFQILQYGQSDYVREFGMTVATDPMTVPSRVLNPPTLKYGQGAQNTIRPRDGSWNMRDKRLFRPATIGTWAVVVYEGRGRCNPDVAQEIVKGFIDGARSVGITVQDTQPLIFWENGQGNIQDQLRKAGMECNRQKKAVPSLIVVILPEHGNDIYTAVKHFGDVAVGVATQCLKFFKCNRAKLQYWANVMLKVNVKLDGINAVLDGSPLNDPNQPTIVMGADAIHPSPGSDDRPSFTALVSSVDSTTAKYIASLKVQKGRQEIIDDLKDMCSHALAKYKAYQAGVEKKNKPPTRLIFYRDGVSEGQFEHVLQEELPQIQKACAEAGIKPKITLIVVGKRHHIRMFPQNPQDADRSGNSQAGTTIDQGIGHPTEFDYYQLTHGGLLGTSRPAHYSVLYDDNGFSADAMQNLSFSLCHVYARATRSVSIPAPVYYADIVCSRAKHHFSPTGNINMSDTATVSSQAGDYLETYKASFMPSHIVQSTRMYFM